MQLNQLRFFLAVVDQGGMKAAAAATGVAQPSLSQSIGQLERELGGELFHRLSRGVALTAAGRALVGPARRIVRDAGALSAGSSATGGRLVGRLTIATMPAMSSDPTAAMVAGFRARHPDVTVAIRSVESARAATASIRRGSCEVAICSLPFDADATELTARVVGTQEYCVVFPPGTELPDADPLPLADLPDVALVVVRRGNANAERIDEAVAAAGAGRRPAAVVENPQARLPFVAAGVGGSFVPLPLALASRVADDVVVRRVEPALRWDYGMVYDESALSAAGRAFVAAVLGGVD